MKVNATTWLIARRYFRSRKRQKFINRMTTLAWLGVGVSTMAMLLVLSVFNGLEDLLRQQFSKFNPDLKVLPAQGKTFLLNDSLRQKIKQTDGIDTFSEVIEDEAVVRYHEKQMVARIKGVSHNYGEVSEYPKHMVAGRFVLQEDDYYFAIIGYGVYRTLSYAWGDINPLEIWYPNRKGKITLSERDLQKGLIQVGGIFEVEFEQDARYILVPLPFAQALMQYEQERSALEIKAKQGKVAALKTQLKKRLGDAFLVLDREEQQADILRAIRTEKLFAGLALGVILLIAALNIFYTLSMVVIEKSKDISILCSMGAPERFIRHVFLLQGAMIGLSGALSGILLGSFIVWLQERYGLIKMGVVSSIVEAYPVRLAWQDVCTVGLCMILLTIVLSYIPAQKAARSFRIERL
ncbi:MAG: membrane protein [Thermonema sp.]|uniref:ABC transporter permease n=1 Tax=Thermonema sp. TaxID=2231181 RepID=UPI0021DBE178|nr:FtsX-like permease family protein [Thermonema sp.]GIV39969.1 MAG: membrane protein [Thermonema sp.]